VGFRDDLAGASTSAALTSMRGLPGGFGFCQKPSRVT
jgi:hypothetical protein